MGRSNEAWILQLGEAGPDQQAALRDLRETLVRGLRRALSTHTHADDAFLEDIAQDALLRILDRLSQFEGRSRFATWATSIAIRIAMTELRRRRWKDVSLDQITAQGEITAQGGGLPTNAAANSPSENTHGERQAIVDKMHEVIQSDLTEKQRHALLAELKGMPLDEIARRLESNRNAIYKLTHDARKRLKRGLEAAGYQAEDIQTAFAS